MPAASNEHSLRRAVVAPRDRRRSPSLNQHLSPHFTSISPTGRKNDPSHRRTTTSLGGDISDDEIRDIMRFRQRTTVRDNATTGGDDDVVFMGSSSSKEASQDIQVLDEVGGSSDDEPLSSWVGRGSGTTVEMRKVAKTGALGEREN
jgi:hypothetical protein